MKISDYDFFFIFFNNVLGEHEIWLINILRKKDENIPKAKNSPPTFSSHGDVCRGFIDKCALICTLVVVPLENLHSLIPSEI
jgi:hypothetical protein